MDGYQLTFFTEQEQRHGHTPMGDWLMQFVREQGALGAMLVGGAEGFGRSGQLHSTHFFELGEQPVAVMVSVDQAGCDRLMAALAREPIDLSYVKVPVVYGRVGTMATGMS